MDSDSSNQLYRILFVEDTVLDADAFCDSLNKSKLNVNITWFQTAELAMDAVLAYPELYDIVICDYLLPGMTGLELFEKIKTKISIPFIIQTGAGIESFAVKALKSGVDDYFIKDAMRCYLGRAPVIIPQVIINYNARHAHARYATELHASEQRLKSIINTASDAMISIDSDQKIVMWNDAAEDIFGYTNSEAVDKDISSIILNNFLKTNDVDKDNIGIAGKRKNRRNILIVEGQTKDGNTIPLELSSAKWKTDDGVFITLIIRDITDRKAAEMEQKKIIEELQSALSSIKALKGLIPICSSCKKIRDDEGYYHQIEEYILKNSDAQFSHGFCPECAQKLYPELFEDDDE